MSRANLKVTDIDLSDMHVPLRAPSPPPDPPAKEEAAPIPKPSPKSDDLADLYPSLGKSKREIGVQLSVRIYLHQDDDLNEICREFDIPKSVLVRDILSAGIREIKRRRRR